VLAARISLDTRGNYLIDIQALQYQVLTATTKRCCLSNGS